MTRATYSGPPLPIGYVEAQTAWVGEKTAAELQVIIDELRAKALSENPGYQQDPGLGRGARVEWVNDGAGVPHFTMYMGFVPVHASSEPLDPRNLGGDQRVQNGPGVELTPEDGLGGVPLGWSEKQFGRGIS